MAIYTKRNTSPVTSIKLKGYYAGWSGALVLLFIYIALEAGTALLGGDSGAFLYVTLHFIAFPILSALLIYKTFKKTLTSERASSKMVHAASLVVPAAIIYIAVTGTPFFIQLMGIRF